MTASIPSAISVPRAPRAILDDSDSESDDDLGSKLQTLNLNRDRPIRLMTRDNGPTKAKAIIDALCEESQRDLQNLGLDEDEEDESVADAVGRNIVQNDEPAAETIHSNAVQDGGDTSDGEDEDISMASQPPPTIQCQYDKFSEMLIKAHRQGLESLVRTAFDLEDMPDGGWVENRKKSLRVPHKEYIRLQVLMMIGMDSLVLESFTMGNIPYQETQDDELKKRLRKLTHLGTARCPCIYAQYLVDKYGKSPSPNSIIKILDAAKAYCEGFQVVDHPSAPLANQIDAAFQKTNIWALSKSKSGNRRYFEDSNKAKPGRIQVCLDWIESTKSLIKDLRVIYLLTGPSRKLATQRIPLRG